VNYKKEAIDNVISVLRKNLSTVSDTIRLNKRKINDLAYEQKRLKQSRREIYLSIRELEKRK